MKFKDGQILRVNRTLDEYWVENVPPNNKSFSINLEKGMLVRFEGYMDDYDPDYPEEFDESYINISPLVGVGSGGIIYEFDVAWVEKM